MKGLVAFVRRWLHWGDAWDFPRGYLIRNALYGEAFSARMYGDNPDLSPDAVKAYRWAERQFARIARGEVTKHDLIG